MQLSPFSGRLTHSYLMTSTYHPIDIWVQGITLKDLFHLLSDIVPVQTSHIILPILFDFSCPRLINNHSDANCRDRLGRFESGKCGRLGVGPLSKGLGI
jgi:hypothetical protein